jgi:hypothetical protein
MDGHEIVVGEKWDKLFFVLFLRNKNLHVRYYPLRRKK